jgi:hypothetical protein
LIFKNHLMIYFNFKLAFVITKTYVDLVGALTTGGTFWLFSGLSIVGTVFVFFVVPETKGKSLKEIQELLGAEKDQSVVDEEKN